MIKKFRCKIAMFLHLLKRIRPFCVVHSYENDGTYSFSTICIYRGFGKGFVRIKYDSHKCEIVGKIGNILMHDLFEENFKVKKQS